MLCLRSIAAWHLILTHALTQDSKSGYDVAFCRPVLVGQIANLLNSMRQVDINPISLLSQRPAAVVDASPPAEVPSDEDIAAACAVLAADADLHASIVRGLALFEVAAVESGGAARAKEIAALLETSVVDRFGVVGALTCHLSGRPLENVAETL